MLRCERPHILGRIGFPVSAVAQYTELTLRPIGTGCHFAPVTYLLGADFGSLQVCAGRRLRHFLPRARSTVLAAAAY